jgi:mannuronan synthase
MLPTDSGTVDPGPPAVLATATPDRPAKWTVAALAKLALFVATVAAIAVWLPARIWDDGLDGPRAFLAALGGLAIWRYGWWLTHLVRAQYYARVHYPQLAGAAAKVWTEGWRPHRLHFLLTTFRERPETIDAVVGAICAEIRSVGRPATLWLGSKEEADEGSFETALRAHGHGLDIALKIIRQTGSGKRNAIALILAAMAREGLGADDFVAFMDSDFILEPGALTKCYPLFASDPTLHALTTDEDCEVIGPAWVGSWLDMRFAQRRLGMQSHALSGRVLTLTGRFSMFRATHITSAEFIGLVSNDTLDHWLWGEFRFLSGDDKSTWYALLRHGVRMLYVPDAHGYTIEVIEGNGIRRMVENLRRWSGNMLRNGQRAIALGPRRMPLFTWWCLVDQRLSMWTMLFGPLCAMLGIWQFGWLFLVAYVLYVAVTRLITALVLFTFCRKIDFNFVWCLYANQLANASIKLYMIWRLPKQRWANRGNQSVGGGQARFKEWAAGYLTVVSVLTLLLAGLLVTGLLPVPRW